MIDALLIIYFRDGSCVRVEPDGIDALETAMARFTGEREFAYVGDDGRDLIIRLRTIGGGRSHILASSIANWVLTTALQREQDIALSVAIESEREGFLAKHGRSPDGSATSAPSETGAAAAE